MKIWIENGDDDFVMHMDEPYLTENNKWHSRHFWWISSDLAQGILGRKNLPGLDQVAEVECEIKTYWEPAD